MARKWTNLNLPGALHFLTGNLVHRTPAFAQEASCVAFLEVCASLINDWPSKLIAYVLMPDHVQLDCQSPRWGHQRFRWRAEELVSQRDCEG